MISAMSKLHSKAIADELDEKLSAGWIAAGIPPTALENPILKKALELIARKARTTHVHTTVASCSHSHSCSQANAVLDDHLTKLYDTAKSQLQSYAAELAERKKKSGAPERREEDGKRTPMY